LLSIICVAVQSAFATVGGPTIHCFAVNHPYLSFTSPSGTYQENLEALNTTSWVSSINSDLNNYGYYSPSYYLNNTASTVRSSMASDAIFFIYSHSAPGLVNCPYKDASGNWQISRLTATNNHNYSTVYPLSGNVNLSKTRLAFFCGCESACTDGWDFGNLCDTAVSLGADAALGFTTKVYDPMAGFFAYRVLAYYGMGGSILSSCISSSVYDTYNQYKDIYPDKPDGGVSNYKLVGDGSIRLYPAAYGN